MCLNSRCRLHNCVRDGEKGTRCKSATIPDYCEGDESATNVIDRKIEKTARSRMNLSQETCLELNSSFSGKNDDCSGVALF